MCSESELLAGIEVIFSSDLMFVFIFSSGISNYYERKRGVPPFLGMMEHTFSLIGIMHKTGHRCADIQRHGINLHGD